MLLPIISVLLLKAILVKVLFVLRAGNLDTLTRWFIVVRSLHISVVFSKKVLFMPLVSNKIDVSLLTRVLLSAIRVWRNLFIGIVLLILLIDLVRLFNKIFLRQVSKFVRILMRWLV